MKSISAVIGSSVLFVITGFASLAAAEPIRFYYSYTGQNGTTDLQPNGSYTIYDAVGGCGGRDIARCELDGSGTLRAYYKDSCSTGDYGPYVNGGTSSASSHGYTVECSFVKRLVQFTYSYGNRQGAVRLGPGEVHTIYDQVGGCGGADVARCYIDNKGRVQAYYKDSCGTGTWGPALFSGTSSATEVGFTVSCTL
ncbi:MAG TPA: hypothetical protein VE954_31625 [Oligoflexus sp.]|uniref:hypothetical protein n=1 Tax=Oligoflexus sp. TaxID=1971216 RepID=UPI002D3D5201|nr:hypothetical protein [Oligoflexus sp.]HYX37675.1 hypothetical protein [Oligoflexus sp.]